MPEMLIPIHIHFHESSVKPLLELKPGSRFRFLGWSEKDQENTQPMDPSFRIKSIGKHEAVIEPVSFLNKQIIGNQATFTTSPNNKVLFLGD